MTQTGGDASFDHVSVTFGVRDFHFSPDTGLWLNGVNVKILGTANHQDFAAVGVAVPDHLQAHRVVRWCVLFVLQ